MASNSRADGDSTRGPRRRLLALLAALALVGVGVFALVSSLGPSRHAPAATPFLTKQLGLADTTAPLVRRPAKKVTVAIKRSGVHVQNAGHALAFLTGGAPWQRYQGGARRQTPFGSETVTVRPASVEELLTVDRHQGAKTWTWPLGTTLKPSLRPDGGVNFTTADGLQGNLSIRPVQIFDGQGNTVTPNGLRWSLVHSASGWTLELKLDDSALPQPYLIDPTVDYTQTQYLTIADATSLTGSNTADTLSTAAGTACTVSGTTATDCPRVTSAANSGREYIFQPGLTDSTNLAQASTPTATTSRGWIVDAAGSNAAGTSPETVIPAGTWTFSIRTNSITAHTTPVQKVHVGLWKGTVSSAAVTSTQAIVNPTTGAGTFSTFADGTGANNTVTETLNVTLPQIKLASNEHLYLQVSSTTAQPPPRRTTSIS